ncbi:MAG: hypothetical protein WBA74_17590 [Cyclobacteriaceae bacterium]
MKKFKIAYYVIYALFTGLIFYLAANLISVIDTLKDWGWYTYLSELPDIGSKFYYFTGFFLLFAVAVETYFTYQKRAERSKMEKEIINLKAKLYDQGIAIKETPDATVTERTGQSIEKGRDEDYLGESDTTNDKKID